MLDSYEPAREHFLTGHTITSARGACIDLEAFACICCHAEELRRGMPCVEKPPCKVCGNSRPERV